MANTFKTEADNLAKVASALVSKDMAVAATVNRDFSAEFGGKKGATVNVRIPAVLASRSRNLDVATAITLDNLTESTQAVALSTNIYSGVTLSDEDLTLRIEDFAAQVVAPQALGIGEALEALVIAKFATVTENATLESVYTAGTSASVIALFLNARKILRDMAAPQSGLYAVVGTTVYMDLLASGALTANNMSVDMGNGVVGKFAGFTIIESNRVGATEACFYHRDALTLVMRAPVAPAGVAFAASAMAPGGVPLRMIRDYDASALADRSILNVYAGTALMNAQVSSTGTPVNFVIRVNDGAGT